MLLWFPQFITSWFCLLLCVHATLHPTAVCSRVHGGRRVRRSVQTLDRGCTPPLAYPLSPLWCARSRIITWQRQERLKKQMTRFFNHPSGTFFLILCLPLPGSWPRCSFRKTEATSISTSSESPKSSGLKSSEGRARYQLDKGGIVTGGLDS